MRLRALRWQARRFSRGPRHWSVPDDRSRSVGGFVYVIEGDQGAHKIGSSCDPKRRLRELQTGSATVLRIRHTVAVTGNPVAVERAAQDMLAGHRINLEWFDVPADLAVGAIYSAAYRLGALGGVIDAVPSRSDAAALSLVGATASLPFWTLASHGHPLASVSVLIAMLATAGGWHLIRPVRNRIKWLATGALSVGLAFAGSTVMAAEPLPAIDGSRYCASVSGFVNDNALIKKGCLDNETKAERHVRALWSEAPASVRTQCLKNLALVTPSYQGLSGCMSLMVGTMWMNGEVRLTPR